MNYKIIKEKEYGIRRDTEITGKIYEIESDAYNFPFQIYVPNNIEKKTQIIVYNGTPYSFNGTLSEAIEDTKKLIPLNIIRMLSLDYKLPILCPAIPRLRRLDTSYLGEGVYNNNFESVIQLVNSGKTEMTINDVEKFKDLHIQVYKMIKDGIKFLKDQNIDVSNKVIISGYSASSKFSNYFSALHPDIVSAVIAGGTGGLNIIPEKKWNDTIINYPIGVNDVEDFDKEEFKKIKHFYYIGSEDYNNVAMPRCELEIASYDDSGKPVYKKDECGNVIPKKNNEGNIIPLTYDDGLLHAHYDDGYYTPEQITFLHNYFSDDVQKRFDIMKKIYEEEGIESIFNKYGGNHKTVFDNKFLIYEDIKKFIENMER